MVSRKPWVVISAVRAPLRSISALVASVVPWMMIESAEAGMRASASTALIAAITPRSGAAGVVNTFAVKRRPPLSSATSVKVPPMSTPRRWSMLPPPKGGICNP